MPDISDKLAEINASAVQTAARLSKISLESAERVLALQLSYAKATLGDATRAARAATGTQDVQQLFALRTQAAEAALTQLMGYSRGLYEVASETQAEVARIAEERLAELQRTVAESVEEAARNAPAGSDVAIAAMKSSLAAATTAFDTLNKAARHAASFADAGVKAAAPKGRK